VPLKEVRPNDHAAMSGEAFVGEADPCGRRAIGGGNLNLHRLVLTRRVIRDSFFCIITSPPDDVFSFQLNRSG
jgi:hypothetical protein